MEQDHDYSPSSTIWSQPPLTTPRRRKPRIDPVVLIILLPILALVFLFCFLPPFLHHASHILKPGSVKSTWDSLNIFLVLFAIVCGVMARKNDDIISTTDSTTAIDDDQAGNSSSFVATSTSDSMNIVDSSGQWVGFSDRKVGLRRNSSSYPDLRQESVWENHEYPNQYYFDDFNLNPSPVSRNYNSRIQKQNELITNITPVPGDVPWRSRLSDSDPVDVKEIVVDTFENVTPPPPPPVSKRHSVRSVGREFKSDEMKKVRSPPPPPPPPPATGVRVHRSRHKHNKLERKVSDATKEIATAISSLVYTNNQRKQRKNKRKLRNVPDDQIPGSSDTSPTSSVQSPENEQPLAPPPPPPPPPPPSTMFQNLFKKGGKHHKRIHSIMPAISQRAPPPPPPNSIFNNIFKSSGNKSSKRFQSPRTPHPASIMNNIFKTGTKSKRFDSITGKSAPPPPPLPPPMTPPRYTIKKEPCSSISKGKPPLPAPRTNSSSSYYERDEFGSQSPLIPMPPPPPPPPFQMPAMKFELRGDFVKVQSSHSSVCSSPDRGDFIMNNTIIIDAGCEEAADAAGRVFFPSPDVNAKADSFISRLKDEWRMEQIH